MSVYERFTLGGGVGVGGWLVIYTRLNESFVLEDIYSSHTLHTNDPNLPDTSIDIFAPQVVSRSKPRYVKFFLSP